jgi:hypothetical protein
MENFAYENWETREMAEQIGCEVMQRKEAKSVNKKGSKPHNEKGGKSASENGRKARTKWVKNSSKSQ